MGFPSNTTVNDPPGANAKKEGRTKKNLAPGRSQRFFGAPTVFDGRGRSHGGGGAQWILRYTTDREDIGELCDWLIIEDMLLNKVVIWLILKKNLSL